MARGAVERFWSKVDTSGECWVWLAGCGGGTAAYGNFWLNGKTVLAHRFSYELLVGELTDGMQIDHLCRNKVCVNPQHLELVTPRVNTLRGIGPSAQNVDKRACPADHPYDDLNTYVSRKGGRHCRACRSAAAARYRQRQREASAQVLGAADEWDARQAARMARVAL